MLTKEEKIPKQSKDEKDNAFQRRDTDLQGNPQGHPVVGGRTSDNNVKRLRPHKKDEKIVGLKDGLRAYYARRNSQTRSRRQSLQASSTPEIRGMSSKRISTLEEEEELVRSTQETNPFKLLILGNLAAFKVMGLYLVTLDSILACALSAGLTVYWYLYGENRESWTGGGMDWVILGFAVVTPMSVSIGMAFRRREEALIDISKIRSFSYQIYLAHCLWDWDANGGRAGCIDMDWLEHTDKVMAQLIGIGDELCRFLSLPTMSRSRHRMTTSGRKEAARTVELAYRLLNSLYSRRITLLTSYAEDLKFAGLNHSEISRIRQYERFIGEAIEHLRMIKMYRTPQALRSFGRIFTLLLPPFYAPTYAQIAIDLNSLGIGILFAIITALGLTTLFESIQVLEDPFVAFLTLDGIDAREEFQVLHWQQLVSTREMIFPSAPPFPDDVGRSSLMDVHQINSQRRRKKRAVAESKQQRKRMDSEVTFDHPQPQQQQQQQQSDENDDMNTGTEDVPAHYLDSASSQVYADMLSQGDKEEEDELKPSSAKPPISMVELPPKRTSDYVLNASEKSSTTISRSLRSTSHRPGFSSYN